MPRTLEELERTIKRQDERLALLEGILLEGKPYQPGRAEFDRMIQATIGGDRKAMAEYLARGGEIYDEEEPYKRAMPRKRGANNLFPPETEANPATTTVDAKRGTLARLRRTARPGPGGNTPRQRTADGRPGNRYLWPAGDGPSDIVRRDSLERRDPNATGAAIRRQDSGGASFGQPKPTQDGYASP